MPRTDSVTVSINVKPDQVWDNVADLKNWKDFSEFGKNMEKVSPEEWIAHTEQGDIRVLPKFKKEQLVLDHLCILSNGEEVLIPYRVEPVGDASKLTMVNQQGESVADDDYAVQLEWMRTELETIKDLLED